MRLPNQALPVSRMSGPTGRTRSGVSPSQDCPTGQWVCNIRDSLRCVPCSKKISVPFVGDLCTSQHGDDCNSWGGQPAAGF